MPRWTAVVMTAWLGVAAHAQEPVRLPDVPLTTTKGEATSTAAIVRGDRWLLVLVEQPCAPCAPLLAALDRVTTVEQGPALVVVMQGGSPAMAAARPPRSGGLATAGWYLDGPRRLRQALPLGGAPLVFGMDGSRIEWRRAGAGLGDPQLQALVSSWIGQ